MANSINTLFQDPIILAAGLVFAATVIILIWALKTYGTAPETLENDVQPYDDSADTPHEYEASGLLEARIHEISNQLSIIDQRLIEIEKSIKENKSIESTGLASADIDKLTKKLEDLAASAGGPKKTEDLDRIETKLDSIRKLLILLTDGENSSNE